MTPPHDETPAGAYCQFFAEYARRRDLLDPGQRWSVEEARAYLREWDREWPDPDRAPSGRERVFADQIRVLLAVIDCIAPKRED